ncbi:MAG TPA: hypothetical protein VFO41_07450, partial [Alphaproteobacteria bacterium]|nr:hypothetical protein [Alphaproteobacteria bacterium]
MHTRTIRALCLTTTAAALILPAGAAWAETLTVSGITASEASGYRLSVPTVVIEDGNFTEDQVRALFASGDRDAFAALAGLTAKSVSIPEIDLTYTVPAVDTSTAPGAPVTASVSYKGLLLTDVVDGVAASATLESSLTSTSQAATATSTWGTLGTGRLDLGALLGFYGIRPGAGNEAIRSVVDDLRFAGGKVESGTAGAGSVHCDLGEASVENFSARPLKTSLAEISG